MTYHIYAALANGAMVFDGTTNFVPRKGEEFDINGRIFTVSNVRYILREGTTYGTQVRLLLTQLS